MRSKGGCF